MPQANDYVFVLWADKFEALPATVFVTELRRAGLRVKVVGLTSRRIFGSYGLALLPDLTLDQALALAACTICLIIPQTVSGLQSLKNEPRLRRFLERAGQNQARLVVGPLNGGDLHNVGLFPAALVKKVLVYPEREGLLKFARELAGLLSVSL